MTMQDPIADLLTRIRNAQLAGHESVNIPFSKLKLQIVRVLKEEGYVDEFLVSDEVKSQISVSLFLFSPCFSLFSPDFTCSSIFFCTWLHP